MTKSNEMCAVETVNREAAISDAGKMDVERGGDTHAAEPAADSTTPCEGDGSAPDESSQTASADVSNKRTPKSGASRRARPAKEAAASSAPRISKTEAALKLLRRKTGASLAELQDATGWQAHSVRGFLSGTVRKKLALSLCSEVNRQGMRRYRIAADAKAG
jgi:hypothetical protein